MNQSELDQSESIVVDGEATEDESDNQSAEITEVEDGTYQVLVEESVVRWAGKKPLIEGYINSGSMALKSGSISVDGDDIGGELLIDMNTLSVSDTPTKPGSENTLEDHLKGERWFNVAEYPEASFVITSSEKREASANSFVYDVTGDLTMKGQTNELTFPATIFTDANGKTVARADFEFDRTKWGLTSGSGSFFDDLANNAIDDMVALSFELVAEQQ